MGYQMQKVAKELKRDLELSLTQNQASAAGGASTASTMGSMESWLTTNVVNAGTGGSNGGFSSGTVSAPTDGTGGAITEADLKNLAKSCWDNGAEADYFFVGSFNKQAVSGFSGIATLFRDTAPKVGPAAIIGSADIYVSDFGQIKVVADRFQREETGLLVDFDYVDVAYLRPFTQEQLSKTGDSEKRHMLAECTLVVRNEAAHGKIVNLTTS